MARSFASLCALLGVWLCALGAGPVRHPAAQSVVARGAVELALRDVADGPLLVPRVIAARISAARLADRDGPPPQIAAVAAHKAPTAPTVARDTRTTLARQGDAHADRPRWRHYDAAAPPARSRRAH